MKIQRKFDFSESIMKKKIFGIKIGTILTVLVSLLCATAFWLIVKYAQSDTAQALGMIKF